MDYTGSEKEYEETTTAPSFPRITSLSPKSIGKTKNHKTTKHEQYLKMNRSFLGHMDQMNDKRP